MKSVILLALLPTISALFTRAKAFDAAGIKAIVDTHNQFRSQLAFGKFSVNGTHAPTATNMLKIKWDPAVAAIAQAYANKMPKGHSGHAGLGENLFWMWSTGQMNNTQYQLLGSTAVKSWFSEYTHYGFKNAVDMRMGHASQVSWAGSSVVGCGIFEVVSRGYTQVVVCNYKPAGNYVGAQVYHEGKTCSACPTGTKCEKATGLCV